MVWYYILACGNSATWLVLNDQNSLLSLYFLIIRKLINDIIWFHMVDSVENVCHEQFYYAIYRIDHPFWCMHIYYIHVCQKPCNSVAWLSLIYEENLGSKFPLPHFFNNCIIKNYIFTYMGFEGYPQWLQQLFWCLALGLKPHQPPSYLPIKEKKIHTCMCVCSYIVK